MSRYGERERSVLTLWGDVMVRVPRLVCECGGSARLEMGGWLRPHQRIGEDVDSQIRRWGALRVSLREMQAELAQLSLSPLALCTLNQRLQQVSTVDVAAVPFETRPCSKSMPFG